MSHERHSLTALTPALAARILQQAGSSRVTKATVQADIDAGAPVTEDGTINMIAYAAWLVRENARGS